MREASAGARQRHCLIWHVREAGRASSNFPAPSAARSLPEEIRQIHCIWNGYTAIELFAFFPDVSVVNSKFRIDQLAIARWASEEGLYRYEPLPFAPCNLRVCERSNAALPAGTNAT
ncbi:hypothetical protein BN2476_460002 [Paraburkholderia piptadeniae]|uniref:Uncharacterized protein n=1 Tax=Paraburkholderia piptadeniae TaxID=1701573 RepID=A0A1N7SCG1_9BURK|nr:hypothetical protein BN2476_460002 [Paraburkholderia piptadeniae]